MSATDLSKILSSENFENRSGKLSDINGFGACRNGTIETYQGQKVVRSWIGSGRDGYGEWGYTWKHPDLVKCREGDEVWFRLRTFFPNDFEFDSAPGFLKGFRVGRRKIGNDDNRGYVDGYINNSDQEWRVTCEMDPKPPGQTTGWTHFPGGGVETGVWQTFEFYVYLSRPNGKIRMWRDGELFGEVTRSTISPDGHVDRVLWTTYYNGGSPKTQGMLFDDHAVAIKNNVRDDKRWLATDNDGNRFIGLAGISDSGEPPVEPPIEPPVQPPIEPPVEPPVEPPTKPELPDLPGRIGNDVATMIAKDNCIFVYTSLPVVVVAPDD